MGTIILFYKYVSIPYPKQILKWLKKLCADLQLTGRILLANEGINGTVAGDTQNIDRLIQLLDEHELFGNIDFKKDEGDASYFPRMQITIRPEVVHLGLDTQKVTPENGGTHLKPEEVHSLLEKNPDDLVVLDTRNNYEWEIGKFKQAITPDIDSFREFPKYVDEHLDTFKNKQVLMYCTGGIRCERATAYLNQKGIAKKVFQIEGGIVRYCEKYPEGFFRGKNYVFDRRIAVKINEDILGHCRLCDTSADDYTNCLNAECNDHYIACTQCFNAYKNCCSKQCFELVSSKKVRQRIPFEAARSGK